MAARTRQECGAKSLTACRLSSCLIRVATLTRSRVKLPPAHRWKGATAITGQLCLAHELAELDGLMSYRPSRIAIWRQVGVVAPT